MSSKLKMTSLHKLKLLVLFSSCSVCCCLLLLVGCKICTFISRPFIKPACFTTFLAVSHFPFYNRESNKIQSSMDQNEFQCTFMAIWLLSFQAGDSKLERFLPTNQHTRRKLLNFENWCNGEVSKIGHYFRK